MLCAYIDAEHTFSSEFAKMVGVDLDMLAIIQETTAEDAIDAIKELLVSKIVNLITLDSVASLSPKEERDKSSGELSMALLARLLSRKMKDLVALANQNKCSLLFLNQLRDSLSYTGGKVAPGGNALTFYSSVNVRTRKKLDITKQGEVVGVVTQLDNKKNKVSTPFSSAEIDILFPHKNEEGKMIAGIDIMNDIIDAAINKGVITKSGSWLEYQDSGKLQGKHKMGDYFKENPNMFKLLNEEMRR